MMILMNMMMMIIMRIIMMTMAMMMMMMMTVHLCRPQFWRVASGLHTRCNLAEVFVFLLHFSMVFLYFCFVFFP